ncbi:MAG: hypothetical protein KF911_03500 [Pseudomonadales bacterium]|nr:hypothetical protein [Pseudomonadales bacterium]
MTISELGSLAEIIGSIAVLITLVILVFQVRGARLELSSQMTREIKRDNNDAFHQLIQRPDLVDIHIRGQREYNNLCEAEKITWLLWLFTWINQTEDAWMARNRGILDMEWVDAYMVGVARVLRSDGGRIAWPILRGNFESPFTEALERTIREGEETFLDAVLSSDELSK